MPCSICVFLDPPGKIVPQLGVEQVGDDSGAGSAPPNRVLGPKVFDVRMVPQLFDINCNNQ